MGTAMCDFAVRELRDAVTGPMVCVRLGTCGVVRRDVNVGSVVVASEGSVAVRRDADYFGLTEEERAAAGGPSAAYSISRPVPADAALSEAVAGKLRERLAAMSPARTVVEAMNATACSFYSSQGRRDPAFADDNDALIDGLEKSHPKVVSLEMESFHLLDLARVCRASTGGIRAAAVAIALAQRHSNEFLDNDSLYKIEEVAGAAIVDVLVATELEGAMTEGVWSAEDAPDAKRAKKE
jgi:uridine phosphorylase